MSLIDREALYEKACDLEAQALSYVGKIVNDKTRTEEWKIWSVVLAERTAFKHDIFDAPEAQPEQRTCVNCGRTVNNGGWYADGRTRCPIEEHYALPKDGYCHLWEKRNVTDDDYPERRTDDSISD